MMLLMFRHSAKRLMREGAKSLSVPLIALVFVILINLLGGIRIWLETQYEDILDYFPIIAVVSDLTGENTDELNIGMRYIDLFLDPDVNFSLMEHTGDIAMMRTLDNAHIPGHTSEITLIAITDTRADASLDPFYGSKITLFDGYDESIFLSSGLYALVSDDLYPLAINGKLDISISVQLPDEIVPTIDGVMYQMQGGEMIYFILHEEKEGSRIWSWMELLSLEDDWWYIREPGEIFTITENLTVIGTITGAEQGVVYSPFWRISELAEKLTEVPPFAESLSITLRNNRELDDFKDLAAMSFSRVNPISGTRPFAMTIMDLEFYETLEPLRQNIIVVDIATPFIYILSIAIGFLTSVLLTRRRKAEFAIMRSIGVSKWVVFTSALAEQSLLSVAGAALGFAFVSLVWDYASLTRPAIFLACYLIGAVFASIGAAGTNVMKVLRDRGE
jgi:hypothetical protein